MNSTMEAPTMSSERRKLLILTDTMDRQIDKRKDKSGCTRRGLRILSSMLHIDGAATRAAIAEINGYSVGGVSTTETNHLLRDDLITEKRIVTKSKGSGRYACEFRMTDKGRALMDYVLTGKAMA